MVELELGTNDDDRTTGVIDALAQKILTEASLLALEHIAERFQGALILWVGGVPMALRRGEKPVAQQGSAKAFGLFWIDQYRYIGLVLLLIGVALTGYGWI